jgi:chromosome segregation ATPase
MAENNTNALIEALEGVMRDFNTKINEQFGDNFRQLNEAMGKILGWQDQYREQMDQLASEFRIAAESVDQSRESLISIAEQASSIVSSADRLEPVLSGIQTQQGELEERLAAFSQLRQDASEAFPLIEQRIQQLTTGFSDQVESAVDTAVSIAQMAQTEASNQREQLRAAITQSSDQVEAMGRASAEASQRAAQRLTEQLDTAFRQAAERITQQVGALDASLENELNNALTTLGSQLASLSNRFVQDYTPLTNSLRAVVELARDMPPSTAARTR